MNSLKKQSSTKIWGIGATVLLLLTLSLLLVMSLVTSGDAVRAQAAGEPEMLGDLNACENSEPTRGILQGSVVVGGDVWGPCGNYTGSFLAQVKPSGGVILHPIAPSDQSPDGRALIYIIGVDAQGKIWLELGGESNKTIAYFDTNNGSSSTVGASHFPDEFVIEEGADYVERPYIMPQARGFTSLTFIVSNGSYHSAVVSMDVTSMTVSIVKASQESQQGDCLSVDYPVSLVANVDGSSWSQWYSYDCDSDTSLNAMRRIASDGAVLAEIPMAESDYLAEYDRSPPPPEGIFDQSGNAYVEIYDTINGSSRLVRLGADNMITTVSTDLDGEPITYLDEGGNSNYSILNTSSSNGAVYAMARYAVGSSACPDVDGWWGCPNVLVRIDLDNTVHKIFEFNVGDIQDDTEIGKLSASSGGSFHTPRFAVDGGDIWVFAFERQEVNNDPSVSQALFSTNLLKITAGNVVKYLLSENITHYSDDEMPQLIGVRIDTPTGVIVGSDHNVYFGNSNLYGNGEVTPIQIMRLLTGSAPTASEPEQPSGDIDTVIPAAPNTGLL